MRALRRKKISYNSSHSMKGRVTRGNQRRGCIFISGNEGIRRSRRSRENEELNGISEGREGQGRNGTSRRIEIFPFPDRKLVKLNVTVTRNFFDKLISPTQSTKASVTSLEEVSLIK